jgi:hypothetical protein
VVVGVEVAAKMGPDEFAAFYSSMFVFLAASLVAQTMLPF